MKIIKSTIAAIFNSVFKDKIDEFEKRIHSLENKLELQNEKIADNKSENKETNKNLNEVEKSVIRIEATFDTMKYLGKQKSIKK